MTLMFLKILITGRSLEEMLSVLLQKEHMEIRLKALILLEPGNIVVLRN